MSLVPKCMARITLACLAATLHVEAATISWTNLLGGNWNTANNWSPHQVPGTADDVVVNSNGTYTITATSDVSISSFTSGSSSGTNTLFLNGANLTITNGATIGSRGVLKLKGSTLALPMGMSVNGRMNCTNGLLSPGSSLTIGSGGILNIGTNLLVYGAVTNRGIVNQPSGYVQIANDGSSYSGAIWNEASGLWDIRSDQSVLANFNSGLEQFHNAGTLRKSLGTADSGIWVYLDNSGTVEAQTGRLLLYFESNLGGQFLADEGAIIGLAAGNFTAGSSNSFSGAGANILYGGNLTLMDNAPANLQLNGGVILLSPQFQGGTITNLTLTGASLSGNYSVSGAFSMNGGLTEGGLLTGASGAQLNLTNAIVNTDSSVLIDVGADLNIAGTLSIYGPVTNRSLIVQSDGYAQIANDGGLYQGAIWNEASALWDIQCDQGVLANFNSGLEQFHNAGTLRKSMGSGDSGIWVYLDNSGTVEAQTGRLLLYYDSNLGGQFIADAGAIFGLASGSFTAGSSTTFSGAGTNIFYGATLLVTDNVPANLQLAGGNVILSSNFQGGSITNLILAGASLTGSNAVVGNLSLTGGSITAGILEVLSGGELNVTNTTISIDGALVIEPGATMSLGGGGLEAYGPITNRGVVLQNNYVQIANDGVQYNGAIWNEPSGLWDFQADAGIIANFNSGLERFHNFGTLRKSAGSGDSGISVYLDNRGAVRVQSGRILLYFDSNLGGQFIADADATFGLVAGNFAAGSANSFSGSGLNALFGGTLTLLDNPPSNLQLNGGNVWLSSAFQGGTITNLTLDGASLLGTNTVTGTLVMNGGLMTDGALSVSNGAIANLTNGTVYVDSSLTIASGGTLNMGGNLAVYGPMTNSGVVLQTSGSAQIANDGTNYLGEIWNAGSGLWNIQCDGGILDNFGLNLEEFYNAGTLRKSSSAGDSDITAALENGGLLDVQSGRVVLSGLALLNNGTVNFSIHDVSQFGSLYLVGTNSMSGALSATLASGFVLNPGDAFPVVGYDSQSGAFSGVTLPTEAVWQTNYGSNAFTLTVLSLTGSPAVTSVFPINGPVGTLITISGNNLTLITNVLFNGVSSAISSSSASSLTVIVPPTATTGPLTLVDSNGVTYAAGNFTVTPAGLFPLPLPSTRASILAWGGTNVYGETNVPTGLIAAAFASGYWHNLAVMTNGRVSAWGLNDYGQTTVPAGLSNVVAVAAGHDHSLALRKDGTVVGWGDDLFDQIEIPADLTTSPGLAIAIAAGAFHSAALRADGTVECWGYDFYGETDTPAGLSNVIAIACGNSFTMALRSDGTVVAWGDDYYGQTDVPPALSNVVAIAAGGFHGLALLQDGTIAGWGTTNANSTAINYGQSQAPDDATNVVAIGAGYFHSLAIRANGSVRQWGDTSLGQTRGFASNSLSRIVAVGGGYAHSLAMKDATVLITNQPVDVTTNIGATARFTVGATGATPLTYRWFFAGNGTNQQVGTATTLTLSAVGSNSAGPYFAVASNVTGAVTSRVATLSLFAPTAPAIVTNPASLTVNPGSNVTFAVVANGTQPLAYQWWMALTNTGTTNVVTNSITDATNAILVLTNVQPSDSGRYFVTISNIAGAATSANATLTVRSPPAITSQPVDVITNSGATVRFTVIASGTAPLTYRWYFAGGATNTLVGSVATLTITGVTSNKAGPYFVTVSNAAGVVVSDIANLTLYDATTPAIVTQPATQTVNQGTNVTFSVSVLGSAPFEYQWWFVQTNVVGGTSNYVTSAIPDATNQSYSISNVQPANGGLYFVVVTNDYGSATSANASLIVRIPPSITNQPVSVSTNVGATVRFSAGVIGTAPLTYRWFFNRSGTNVQVSGAATYIITSVNTNQNGSYFVTVSNAAGSVTSSVVTLNAFIRPSLNPAQLWLLSHSTVYGDAILMALEAGKNYRVQSSSNLADWIDVTNFLSDSALMYYTNNIPPDVSSMYYRIVSP